MKLHRQRQATQPTPLAFPGPKAGSLLDENPGSALSENQQAIGLTLGLACEMPKSLERSAISWGSTGPAACLMAGPKALWLARS